MPTYSERTLSVYFYLLERLPHDILLPTMVCVRTLEGEKDTHTRSLLIGNSVLSVCACLLKVFDRKTPGFFGYASPHFPRGFNKDL